MWSPDWVALLSIRLISYCPYFWKYLMKYFQRYFPTVLGRFCVKCHLSEEDYRDTIYLPASKTNPGFWFSYHIDWRRPRTIWIQTKSQRSMNFLIRWNNHVNTIDNTKYVPIEQFQPPKKPIASFKLWPWNNQSYCFF